MDEADLQAERELLAEVRRLADSVVAGVATGEAPTVWTARREQIADLRERVRAVRDRHRRGFWASSRTTRGSASRSTRQAGHVPCICRPRMQEPPDDPVSDARAAIWRLFDAGLLDEDHATEALLAISVGLCRRRAERNDGAQPPDPRV